MFARFMGSSGADALLGGPGEFTVLAPTNDAFGAIDDKTIKALIMEPSLLLADEPTGDLDEHTADALHHLLRGMTRERALTSVIATHNPRLAAACDRVLRLEEGRLRAA